MINKLTDEISVSPQIAPSDVAALAASGFRSIISNRPDGEGGDQPLFAEIEKAARERGVETRYLPVATGKVSDSDTDDVQEQHSPICLSRYWLTAGPGLAAPLYGALQRPRCGH